MNATIRFFADQLRRTTARRDPNEIFAERLTFGDRLADRIAVVGGSWSFIIGFTVFLVAWAILNTVVLAANAFDPFPFIFLNLMLSMLAALQAPIIMMSQNRQAAKDRLAARLDYETNLRSEAEIANLHAKVDALTSDIAMLLRLQLSGSDLRSESAEALN
ncbi:Uncharacterized membrane protein [Rhizobium sp. RU35A]|uniref:DUF1003 domain-containing protein n=1 Tax=Rhizobium straminoryzae TaxID=1387186 RepID=A0A549T5D1_9HYPH|nr:MULTISPECIES: DUF1003 domain-containing protein [Rhizobium]TRL37077.1 DUF1003 domain-containing protein [Rhizobium straminoryzae]SIQ70672.1 Uncharacterized membrane protein [Rhizobium sp. RU35A]